MIALTLNIWTQSGDTNHRTGVETRPQQRHVINWGAGNACSLNFKQSVESEEGHDRNILFTL